MKIKVSSDGSAVINGDIPVFIGASSNWGYFPLLGAPLRDFYFQPEKEKSGTLVFDLPKVTERKPISATFFHFGWKAGKLIVDEGFDPNKYRDKVRLDSELGVIWDGPYVYHTAPASNMSSRYKQVGIIDLLRFAEGKITFRQLAEKVIT